MVELIRANDIVLICFARSLLEDAGIPVLVADEHMSAMEGSIGIKIEGVPYFHTEPGDIITAAAGRWHRAGNDPSAPWSTRVPINPRPPILHNFEAKE